MTQIEEKAQAYTENKKSGTNMKDKTKNIIVNALYYLLMAIIVICILRWTFLLGEVKGMTETYKTQLKEQIRLLENSNEKIIELKIKKRVNDGE